MVVLRRAKHRDIDRPTQIKSELVRDRWSDGRPPPLTRQLHGLSPPFICALHLPAEANTPSPLQKHTCTEGIYLLAFRPIEMIKSRCKKWKSQSENRDLEIRLWECLQLLEGLRKQEGITEVWISTSQATSELCTISVLHQPPIIEWRERRLLSVSAEEEKNLNKSHLRFSYMQDLCRSFLCLKGAVPLWFSAGAQGTESF